MAYSSCAILLATYNGESYLEEQLDSLFAQTYTDFTLYISDDVSTDGTLKIIQEYMNRYDNIKFICNEKCLGHVKNFEKLLVLCDEEYIAFCDQDDIWEKEKLQIEMALIQKYQQNNLPCLVHSDLSMIDNTGQVIHNSYFTYRNYILDNQKNLGHILGPCGVLGNTILMNKKLKEFVLPFPDNLDVHDYWIAVNCELFGKRVTLQQQLVGYRIHNSNSSNTSDSLKKLNTSNNNEVHLPNFTTKRKYFLPNFREKVYGYDRKILEAYLEYLEFKKNRIYIYFNLLRYSLVKRGLFFRVKLFFKILRKKRM